VRSEADFDSVEEKVERLKSKATLSLYALAYQSRDEFYGNFYSGLTSCSLRFDHTMDGDPRASAENQVRLLFRPVACLLCLNATEVYQLFFSCNVFGFMETQNSLQALAATINIRLGWSVTKLVQKNQQTALNVSGKQKMKILLCHDWVDKYSNQ